MSVSMSNKTIQASTPVAETSSVKANKDTEVDFKSAADNQANNDLASAEVSDTNDTQDVTTSPEAANPHKFQQQTAFQQQPLEQIKFELLKQFEYYFSSKNLLTDNYLLSQMDQEAYVPVSLISQFKRIKQLTNDYDLIISTIRQSSQLQLDPITSSKVRSIGGHTGGLITITKKFTKQPYLMASQSDSTKEQPGLVSSSNQQQRCVLIMREVVSEATLDQIKELFLDKEPLCPPCDQCESAGNDSWYITFANEDDAQRALTYLKAEVQTFMDKPIRARIKAHTVMPRSSPSTGLNTSPMSSPHPSSVYPVINRVINDSPSSFLSPSASPILNEINIVPGSNNNNSTVILPNYTNQQQPFLVQTNVMSPNYKNFILPTQADQGANPNTNNLIMTNNHMNQQGAMPQYWQINPNSKLGPYYGQPTAPIISPQSQNFKQQTLSPLPTTNESEQGKQPANSPKAVKVDEAAMHQQNSEAVPYQYPSHHPQNLIQMQLNVGYNGQAVAQAAAVQAYYQSLSQSPSQQNIQQQPQYVHNQVPLQQSSLLSSSSSSSLSSTPINLNNSHANFNMSNNNSFQSPSNQSQAGQQSQYIIQQSQFPNQPNYYMANNNNQKDNNKTPPTNINGTSSTNPTPSAGNNNNGSSNNQLTSPPAGVFNPNPYLIQGMNNIAIGNVANGGVSAAAINAAYQYYHAYNNAINPNYQGSNLNHPINNVSVPSQYFEVAQASPSETTQTNDTKTTEAQNPASQIPTHLVYNQSNASQFQGPVTNTHQVNHSIRGGSSPQLSVSTMNSPPNQPQSNPQFVQYMNNSSFNHAPSPQPPTTSTQHFSNNQRRNNTTSSLTETRFHNQQHFQQFNHNRNNYRKYSNNNNNDSSNYIANNTSPAALLSPSAQGHNYYNYNNQYNQYMNNQYYNSKVNNGNYVHHNNNSSNERPTNNGQFNSNAQKEESKNNNEASTNEKENVSEDSANKQLTKSPPINCDLVSFPPLLNALSTNNTNQQPVNNNSSTAVPDSLSASAQLDPAIISISNSANSIPNTPTIINTNGAVAKVAGKKQGNNFTKILASASSNESGENSHNSNQTSQHQHHSKQYEKPINNRTQSGSNQDHYSPKQNNYSNNHQNHHHQGGPHNHNNYHSYKSGGGYGRKSVDSLHFNNSRGSHQGQKFYQQNGRNNNYSNSRQNNQFNNSGNNSSANANTESSPGSHASSSAPSNSNRNNNKKTQQSPSNNSNNSSSNNNTKNGEITNSDDDQSQNGCWGNKKLTFAEILQKKSSAAEAAAAAAVAAHASTSQQDSVQSVSSNASTTSSQASTPTANQTKSFPLALSNTIANSFSNATDKYENNNTKLIDSNELQLSKTVNNSSIPV